MLSPLLNVLLGPASPCLNAEIIYGWAHGVWSPSARAATDIGFQKAFLTQSAVQQQVEDVSSGWERW